MLSIPTRKELHVKFAHLSFSEYDVADDDARLEYMNAVKNIQKELLTVHRLNFENVRGDGYRIMTPDEQVKESVEKKLKEASKKFKLAKSLVTNIRFEDIEDKAEFLHAQRYIGFIEGMHIGKPSIRL